MDDLTVHSMSVSNPEKWKPKLPSNTEAIPYSNFKHSVLAIKIGVPLSLAIFETTAHFTTQRLKNFFRKREAIFFKKVMVRE